MRKKSVANTIRRVLSHRAIESFAYPLIIYGLSDAPSGHSHCNIIGEKQNRIFVTILITE